MTNDKSLLILGIDTSGEYCSVGLAKGDVILGEISEKTPQAHSDKLIPFIDKLLKENNLKIQDIDAIAVSIGPGSFTGLRVGVATAKALAQGLNIPIVGVPTLDVIAMNAIKWDSSQIKRDSSSSMGTVPILRDFVSVNLGQSPHILICPIVDAKKEQIYTAFYKEGSKLKKLTKDLVLPVDELLANICNTEQNLPLQKQIASATPRNDKQRGTSPRATLSPAATATCRINPTATKQSKLCHYESRINPCLADRRAAATIFFGNAITTYGDKIKENLGDRAIFTPEELWYPKAGNVASEGFKKLQKNKKGDNLFKLKPIYLREPDIRNNVPVLKKGEVRCKK